MRQWEMGFLCRPFFWRMRISWWVWRIFGPGGQSINSLLHIMGEIPRTSNCQRSTCSPVSLLVITTTSLEILPPIIHLSSCDMIFLIYALTWSSDDTSIVRPYFLTLRTCELCFRAMEEWSIRCEVFSRVDTSLEAGTQSEFADLEGIF